MMGVSWFNQEPCTLTSSGQCAYNDYQFDYRANFYLFIKERKQEEKKERKVKKKEERLKRKEHEREEREVRTPCNISVLYLMYEL